MFYDDQFRVDDDEATAAHRWADALGIEKSELLREALHRHLTRLGSEHDVETWSDQPLTDDESAIGQIAEWDRPKTGRTGSMQRGEVWFAETPGGVRPVLVLTRDPVADRIGSVVVAAITRTVRGLVSERELTASEDGVPTGCVVNFDNIHTVSRNVFRRRIVQLDPRDSQVCQRLRDATGC